MTVKAIQGNLPLNKVYHIIETFVNDEDCFCTCENCGNILKNYALLGDEDNNKWIIGLDCASILSSLSDNHSLSELDVKQAKKELNRKIKMIKWIKTECKTVIVSEYETGKVYTLFDKDVNKWQNFWRYRFSDKVFSQYGQYIKGIKTIYENE